MPTSPKVDEARERLTQASDPMPELPMPRQDHCGDCGLKLSDVRLLLESHRMMREALEAAIGVLHLNYPNRAQTLGKALSDPPEKSDAAYSYDKETRNP